MNADSQPDMESLELEALDEAELLARMEGGFFSLLQSDEEYGDLFKVAAALGIKDFVRSKMGHLEKGRLLGLFGDGEQVITLFIRHAVERDLLEPDDSGSGDED